MSLRTRLIILSVVGLAIVMSIWGWVQLRALDRILADQQITRLADLADTVATYYRHFPSKRGLSAMDQAIKEIVHNDMRLARIDLFAVNREKGDIEFIAGAGRVSYDWPEQDVVGAVKETNPQYMRIKTEAGPALGLLFPLMTDNRKMAQVLVGVIVFSQAQMEVLSRAQRLLFISATGLLIVILGFLALSFRWLIGGPLQLFINTIDESQKGRYVKRIPLNRTDEWGQLAEHFNSMADEIEQVMAKNEELNRDLSERVQEETYKVVQLQTQVNELQKLTALGYLTATMAHDLGTPLHSIGGLAKLILEKGNLPPDVVRKLELIVQQTQRLNAVIQNVRRATRLPELHIEPVSAGEILNETLILVEPLMQSAGIDVEVKIDPSAGHFYADRYRVQTALFNLMQNAVEAMPGGGRITIAAHLEEDSRHVAISIEDHGAGMTPEVLKKVCDPFFSTRDEGLRGLGLAIVQDIMKAHGGRFEISSKPMEGTKVILRFQTADAHVS